MTAAYAPEYEIAELVWAVAPEQDRRDLDRARLPLNDYGNGQRLVSRFRKRLIHVDGIGWHVWDGRHWSAEAGEQEAVKLAHQTAQKIWFEARALEAYLLEKERDEHAEDETLAVPSGLRKRIGTLKAWAIDSGNASRVRAMLAAALPYLRVPARDMDTHAFLFNCLNGTLVFERGKEKGQQPRISLKRHDPDDLITRLAHVDYKPGVACPEWDKLLGDVLPKEDVAHYLQVVFGYTMTGDTSEQVVNFLTGEGSNGKSTIVDAISKLEGNYAVKLPIQSFMDGTQKRGGDATADLARLPATRFVRTSEPKKGMALEEGLVKDMTGGEPINSRQLYEKEMVEFYPQFKVIIPANHKPKIRGQDHGIWRRVRIVPFDVLIAKEKQDKQLSKRLEKEYSGILNWMVEGLRYWLAHGLPDVAEVQAATETYRAESDPIGQFVQEVVRAQPGGHVQAARMYSVYQKWANANGMEPWSKTAFGLRMGELKFRKERVGNVFYVDVELAREEFGEPEGGGDGGNRGGDPPAHDGYDGPGE